ncbi:MAG: Sec-independent protein translocase protein TatC [Pseudomonadota bacterium]|jgi:sec-independent protein translocase protein TatC
MAQEESFISHLVELRDRLIKSLIVVLLIFGVCFYFSRDILWFLSLPLYDALPAGTRPVFLAGEGAFFTLTKVAFLSALLFSLPWVLYQAWAFVAPGLYAHEKRFALPLIFSSVFFLVVGISFAYLFVLPAAYKFFFAFAEGTGAEVMQDLQKYWDFTLAIFFGFGLAFEVPVVEMLLVKLGMVTTEQLRQIRRYVVVGAFIAAAILTPPDVLSQFMLAIPLILLYELGIFLSGFLKAYSRAPEVDEPDTAEEGAAKSEAAPTGSGVPGEQAAAQTATVQSETTTAGKS